MLMSLIHYMYSVDKIQCKKQIVIKSPLLIIRTKVCGVRNFPIIRCLSSKEHKIRKVYSLEYTKVIPKIFPAPHHGR